jgi:hypothetical protein
MTRVFCAGACLLVVLMHGCTCNAAVAACDQTLIALCDLEEACGSGFSSLQCRADRPDFTCSVDVDSAEVCVEAINDALRNDCAGLDSSRPL